MKALTSKDQNSQVVVKKEALSRLTLKITKGTTPTTIGGRFSESGIRFIKVESIDESGNLVADKVMHIDEKSDELLKRSKLELNDVLFSIAGAIGRTYLVKQEDLPANVNQALAIIRFNKDIVEPSYGFYAVRNRVFQNEALGRVVQCAQANINLAQLGHSSIRVPRRDSQKRIAATLEGYDHLININARQIQLLDESARQLYKEWFVRLRFPGCEHTKITKGVPEGWEKKPLGDSIVLNYGKALKAEIRVEGDVPVFGSSGIVGWHDKPFVNGAGIVVGRKGNVGSVYWSNRSFYPIDTVYYVDPEQSNLYLYYALQHMHFISTDVAVPGLNRDFAYSRHLMTPRKATVRLFLDYIEPIRQQIDKLQEMNDKLRIARDLLLPKLMSGEIAV